MPLFYKCQILGYSKVIWQFLFSYLEFSRKGVKLIYLYVPKTFAQKSMLYYVIIYYKIFYSNINMI